MFKMIVGTEKKKEVMNLAFHALEFKLRCWAQMVVRKI